jgi:hypothetical protein
LLRRRLFGPSGIKKSLLLRNLVHPHHRPQWYKKSLLRRRLFYTSGACGDDGLVSEKKTFFIPLGPVVMVD